LLQIIREHGRANALDVSGFTLADGHAIKLTDVTVALGWREDSRANGCARFSTVLGPGSDGYLDLAERQGV
jgi:hypothetical protein